MVENKEIEKPTHQKMMTNWMESETLTLGNHFHGLTTVTWDENSYQERYDPDWRVGMMQMAREDLESLCDKSSKIDSFSLCMALKKSENRELNIAPLLCGFNGKELVFESALYSPIYRELAEIKTLQSLNDDQSGYDKLKEEIEAFNRHYEGLGSALVPLEFLNTVSHNWSLLDPAQIDDLFMAHRPSGSNNGGRRLMRLSKYDFSEKKNQQLFYKLKKLSETGTLKSFKMHFGVDFNKQALMDEFTFTPVIELGTSGTDSNDDLLKLAKDLTQKIHDNALDTPVFLPIGNGSTEGSWLFEYIKPCPPC